MINRGSRHNEGNFIVTTGFCKKLPSEINEADVYYDWSYKLPSRITPQCKPTVSGIPDDLGSLQDAKKCYLLKTIGQLVNCGHQIRDSRSHRQS